MCTLITDVSLIIDAIFSFFLILRFCIFDDTCNTPDQQLRRLTIIEVLSCSAS